MSLPLYLPRSVSRSNAPSRGSFESNDHSACWETTRRYLSCLAPRARARSSPPRPPSHAITVSFRSPSLCPVVLFLALWLSPFPPPLNLAGPGLLARPHPPTNATGKRAGARASGALGAQRSCADAGD